MNCSATSCHSWFQSGAFLGEDDAGRSGSSRRSRKWSCRYWAKDGIDSLVQNTGRLNAYRRGEFSTAVFSLTLAWKVTTRRAVIGTAAPVLGFRPGRCGFSHKSKLPKPESFAPSPLSRAKRVSSKRLRPYPLLRVCSGKLFQERRSARSALVNVIRLP